MKYVRPQILGIFDATSCVQSEKGMPQIEADLVSFTSGAAYQSYE